jgi:glycosyltransferase involved in cell wall biosynthesis
MVRALVRRLADGVIANSPATLATLALPRGAPSWVIPASVEPVEQPREAAPATRFGMLGRIAPWKGQDLFLRAFAAAFGDGQQRAVLIGTTMFGEEQYERELRALVGALGLDGRVEFRGFREDVWPELARLDVLVHASVVPEPFGTVVLEGMAAGLAVIAADEGGPASVVSDGHTGVLFASRDEAALARAMRELDADPGERARLGEAAQAAADAYRPEVIALQIEEVYASVLRER